MRTVLVTGGAGFIGSHLVDQLLDEGAAVRVLDNLSTGSLGNLQAAAERSRTGAAHGSRLEVIVGDTRDREVLRKALRNVKYVFHLASLPASASPGIDPSEIHGVNVDGTLNVLHGALTEGVWRVIVGSCASVYGAPEAVPVAEESPLRPTSVFGASKVAAETYCRAFHARHQLDTVLLRYFTVYGPRQRGIAGDGTAAHLLEAVRNRQQLTDHDYRSCEDFIYIDDAITATLAAARAPRAAGRAINVGSGEMVSIGDVVSTLADVMQISSADRWLPISDGRVHRICAETKLAEELLDFTPRVSLIAGLARTVKSFGQPALSSVALDD